MVEVWQSMRSAADSGKPGGIDMDKLRHKTTDFSIVTDPFQIPENVGEKLAKLQADEIKNTGNKYMPDTLKNEQPLGKDRVANSQKFDELLNRDGFKAKPAFDTPMPASGLPNEVKKPVIKRDDDIPGR